MTNDHEAGKSREAKSREEVQELLPLYTLNELSSVEALEVESVLAQDAELRGELEDLKTVLLGLHFAPVQTEPLEGHKERFMARVQASGAPTLPTPSSVTIPVRSSTSGPQIAPSSPSKPSSSRRVVRRSPLPWLSVGIGVAVALGALTLLRTDPVPTLVNVAPDAAVVVSSGDNLVFASNVQGKYPIVVMDKNGKMHPVEVAPMAKNYWFTEAVAEGGKVYISCGANHMILVVDVAKGVVSSIEKAPSGVAGLSIQNGKLWMKGAANGELVRLEKGNVQTREIGKSSTLPVADYMDAVLPLEKTVWVTHHANGELIALNSDSLEVEKRLELGGAPVALSRWNSKILVADASGKLLWLSESGTLERTLKLQGHPDKLAVQGDYAYLSDRSGVVFQVNLKLGTLERTVKFTHPMDIAALPDGHLALADGPGGVVMLDANLQVLERIGGS